MFNMSTREVPLESVCEPVRPGHVLMPNRRSFESLVGVCRKLSQQVSAVRSEEMQEDLSGVANNTSSCSTSWGRRDVE